MDTAAMIREARQRAGLSQRTLAERAATSQSAVARYESGTSVPSLSTLERLLAACGRRLELRAHDVTTVPDYGALRRQRPALRAVIRRHGGRNPRLFGSVARGEAGPDSDVDLLVDLDRGRTLLDLIAMRSAAQEVLGRDVDVATPNMLRPDVRREAERDAVPL